VTQLLTNHNTQGGPKYQYKYTQTHNGTCFFFPWLLVFQVCVGVCAQVSCSVVSNDPCVIFCGRVYCDILPIFLIPQFCLFLRHQTMDKVQKHNSFNTAVSSLRAIKRNGGITPRILHLSAIWKSVVSYLHRSFNPPQ
jgi:hypothetical protein